MPFGAETQPSFSCDYAFPVSVESKCFPYHLQQEALFIIATQIPPSARPHWKADRTKCFVRKDGFYFKVYRMIVHEWCELLLAMVKVNRGFRVCVCMMFPIALLGVSSLFTSSDISSDTANITFFSVCLFYNHKAYQCWHS